MGKLAREANNRPAIHPNADEIFATLDKLGVPVPQKQQSMGSTYQAAYCIGGYSADRALAINVCEYPSEAAAAAGRDGSTALFPKMTNRHVLSHKSTTLTIVDQRGDGGAEEKKVVSAYLGT